MALWIALVLLGLCVLPIIFVFGVLGVSYSPLRGANEGRLDAECQERLFALGRALALYSVDFDDRYPPARTWIDASWVYATKKDPRDESESVYRCPSISMKRTGEYGYAFNEEFDGKRRSELKEAGRAVLVFDSTMMERNARSGLESLPKPPRHEKGQANYAAFADGAVHPLTGETR